MEQEKADITYVFSDAQELITGGYRMEFFLEAVMDFATICKLTMVWDEEEEQWGVIESRDQKRVAIFHSELPIVFIEESNHEVLIEFLEDRELELPIVFAVSSWSEQLYQVDLAVLKDIIIWHHSISPGQVSIENVRSASI